MIHKTHVFNKLFGHISSGHPKKPFFFELHFNKVEHISSQNHEPLSPLV
jgi:hypothetical protein